MKINGHAIYKHYIRLRIACCITLSPNIMNSEYNYNYNYKLNYVGYCSFILF